MNASTETSCPEVVLASIAWYPDQLDEDRRGLVEAHAAECRACREELALVQGESVPELPAPDAERIYRNVRVRMEHGATRPIDVGPEAAPAARRRGLGLPPTALAAGLALALLGGVIGAVGVKLLGTDPGAAYQVAGGTAPGTPGTASLDVVFRPDARAEELRDGLRAVDAQIVSGPTPLGVYRVALAPGVDAAAAARRLQPGDGRGIATFAQPVPASPGASR